MNNYQSVIDSLAKSYKKSYLKDRSKPGFGKFLMPDVLTDITRDFYEDKNYHSDPSIHAHIRELYFESLARTEIEMEKNGRLKDSMTFAYLQNGINELVNNHLNKMLDSYSNFLVVESSFSHAWFDDMLRAGLKGLRKTDCELLDLPSHYQSLYEPDSLDSVVSEADNSADKSIQDYFQYSRLKRLVITGFALTFLGFGVNKTIDFYFLNRAKDQLTEKETEWKSELNNKLSTAYDRLPAEIESSLVQIGSKYIHNYVPGIDKDLSFEKKCEITWKKLKANEKDKFIKDINKEFKAELTKLDLSDAEIEKFCDIFIERLMKYR